MTDIPLQLYIFVLSIGVIFLLTTFLAKIESFLKIVTSIISAIIFILAGLEMFSGDLNLYSGGSSFIINCGWIGTLMVLIGAMMTLYTVMIIYQVFVTEKIDLLYTGHG